MDASVCWTRCAQPTTSDRGKTELPDDRDKTNSHEFDDHELEYVEKKRTVGFHVSKVDKNIDQGVARDRKVGANWKKKDRQ